MTEPISAIEFLHRLMTAYEASLTPEEKEFRKHMRKIQTKVNQKLISRGIRVVMPEGETEGTIFRPPLSEEEFLKWLAEFSQEWRKQHPDIDLDE
jgi:hypothetical protein